MTDWASRPAPPAVSRPGIEAPTYRSVVGCITIQPLLVLTVAALPACSRVCHWKTPNCVFLSAYRGGGDSGGENFAGKISPLRKVAKFSPRQNLCGAGSRILPSARRGCILSTETCCVVYQAECCNQQRPEQAQYCCAMTHEMTGTFHSPP